MILAIIGGLILLSIFGGIVGTSVRDDGMEAVKAWTLTCGIVILVVLGIVLLFVGLVQVGLDFGFLRVVGNGA